MADSSSPVSALSARWDWNSTIVAAINASAPNNPMTALSRTIGLPTNTSRSTMANPITRLTTYSRRSCGSSVPGNISTRPQHTPIPITHPVTSVAAALNSAALRTLAQNSR